MEIKKRERWVYAVDLDWTLCKGEFWGEWEPAPLTERIEKINKLYKQWNIILIYTARDPRYFTDTYAWLIKYWVMHHWINMSRKPGCDVYLEDKAIYTNHFFDDNINNLPFYENRIWNIKRDTSTIFI